MHDDLPAALKGAVEVLREDVAPNDIWRRRLLHRVGEQAVRGAGRWSLRPWVAIAAGIGCMAVGAGVATVVVRRPDAEVQQTAVALSETVPRVRFTLVAPEATTVSIVGDFNGWTQGSLPLRRSADGRTWEIEVPLAPGRYAYSFVVDGKLARDPSAPQSGGDDFGTPNSVIMVTGS